ARSRQAPVAAGPDRQAPGAHGAPGRRRRPAEPLPARQRRPVHGHGPRAAQRGRLPLEPLLGARRHHPGPDAARHRHRPLRPARLRGPVHAGRPNPDPLAGPQAVIMKRTLALITSLALLGAALAQSAIAPLPPDPRLDQPVRLATGSSGESLLTIFQGLARSNGLSAITDAVPNELINYDIGEPKPFRQVWDLVLTLNDL